MRTRPILLSTLLVATTLLSSCASVVQTLQDAVGQKPTASVSGVRLTGIDLESLTMEFAIDVANPYTFDLPLVDLDFGLSAFATPFLNGSTEVSGSVPAQGTKTIALPVRVAFAGLMSTVEGVRPGKVVPWQADLGIHVDVPGVGPMRLPLSKNGDMPVPAVPEINISSFDWQELSASRVAGVAVVAIGNTNEFPVSLTNLGYDLSLSGQQVADGNNDAGVSLEGGQGGQLTIPLAFSPTSAGLAVVNAILEGESSWGFDGTLDLDTPFGKMAIPFARSGKTTLGL